MKTDQSFQNSSCETKAEKDPLWEAQSYEDELSQGQENTWA